MTRPTATNAILNLLERLNQGFARRDVQQVLDLFAPDPETTFIGSEADELATGPTQLRNLLESLFARPETYHWRWGQLHTNTAGQTAWLVTQATLLVDGPQPIELPYRMTLILQRRGTTWLIVHYHGSEPAAAPQSAPGSDHNA
ncbi:MAG TPA: nuclear transport factor 2 family protein [Pseudonocardiaceae bacterium]|jgi:ketosteroid isomerase-like protein